MLKREELKLIRLVIVFYPDKTKSEGFFCAVFTKKNSDESFRTSKKNKHETFTDIKSKEKELFVNWINSINEHVIIKFKDDYLLTNALAVDFINKYTHLKIYSITIKWHTCNYTAHPKVFLAYKIKK